MPSDDRSKNGFGVVVLTYGKSRKHAAVLDRLSDEGVGPDRLVVVHNPDGSAEGSRAAAIPPGVPVIEMDRNLGYGGAMNAGIEYWLDRDAAWVLLLVDDAVFEHGSLDTLIRTATRGHGYGALAPALVDSQTRAPYSYGGIDMPSNIVGHRTEAPEVGEHGVSECQWVDGAAWMIRADTLREVGLFDETFWMYFEEPELCERIRQGGWKVGVVPAARAETTVAGGDRGPNAYGYLYCRNGLEFARRAGGRRRLVRALASQAEMVWYLAPRPYNRRFYDVKFRRFGYAKAKGMALGAIAYAVGLWGPPPPRLRRASDITGTGPAFRRTTTLAT